MAVTRCFLQGKWLLPSKEIVDNLYQKNSLCSLLSTEPCCFLTDFQELGSGVGTAAPGLQEGQPSRIMYLPQPCLGTGQHLFLSFMGGVRAAWCQSWVWLTTRLRAMKDKDLAGLCDEQLHSSEEAVFTAPRRAGIHGLCSHQAVPQTLMDIDKPASNIKRYWYKPLLPPSFPRNWARELCSFSG